MKKSANVEPSTLETLPYEVRTAFIMQVFVAINKFGKMIANEKKFTLMMERIKILR